MSNVLPARHKKTELAHAWTRFLLMGAVFLVAAAIVAILSVLPALISVRIARASLEASSQNTPQGSISAEQAAATRAQALMGTLGPLAHATSSPTDALVVALNETPAAISITNITYRKGVPGELVLSGTSAQREAVGLFRTALEETGRFEHVAVPVAALVGTQEGRFTMTLSGTF